MSDQTVSILEALRARRDHWIGEAKQHRKQGWHESARILEGHVDGLAEAIDLVHKATQR